MATPNSSFSASTANQNNGNLFFNNNGNSNNNNLASNLDVFVSKDERSSSPVLVSSVFSTLATSNNNNNNLIVDGLTDILYSSYQRRRSIKPQSSSSNCNPFMDDLGFLSSATDNNNNTRELQSTANSTATMKKNPLVIFENENGCDESMQLMSSPMKVKDIPMKSCSIRKSQMHWNHRVASPAVPFSSRRAMSENSYTTPSPNAQLSENGLIHHLPCFDSPHDAIKRITPDTLIDLLEGKYHGIYDRLFVIDCRYPYEYESGHIPSAVNVSTPEVIEELLLEDPQANTLIVFHCEFSSERAPRMALHVRSLDRQRNKANYPNLFYPEMYILDGGYKNYWQQHGEKCEPPHAYLPMRAPQFREQLRMHQKMKYAFKSGCHLSQHSGVKQLPPKSKKPRSKSFNVANARKFFNDLISGNVSVAEEEVKVASLVEDAENDLSFNTEDTGITGSSGPSVTSHNHMFPSYTIPMANSFSSIFASELDMPSEMDIE